MRKSFIASIVVASGLLFSSFAQAGDQRCGTGFIKDLYAGGFNQDEIFLSLNAVTFVAPDYFHNGLQVVRIDPGLDVDHKNRIYSTLLMAFASGIQVELRSHTFDASDVADCTFIDQVTITSPQQ